MRGESRVSSLGTADPNGGGWMYAVAGVILGGILYGCIHLYTM